MKCRNLAKENDITIKKNCADEIIGDKSVYLIYYMYEKIRLRKLINDFTGKRMNTSFNFYLYFLIYIQFLTYYSS